MTVMRYTVPMHTLVEYAELRKDVFGERRGDLTERELAALAHFTQQALVGEKTHGMFVALGSAALRHISFPELRQLARLVHQQNGVVVTQPRDEREGLVSSVRELITLAEETGGQIVIKELRPLCDHEALFEQALALCDQTNARISFVVPQSAWSAVPLEALLPAGWAHGDHHSMLTRLFDDQQTERLLHELPTLRHDALVVATAPHHSFFEGKTIGTIAQNHGVSIAEALLQLMRVTRLNATARWQNINETLLAELREHPRVTTLF